MKRNLRLWVASLCAVLGLLAVDLAAYAYTPGYTNLGITADATILKAGMNVTLTVYGTNFEGDYLAIKDGNTGYTWIAGGSWPNFAVTTSKQSPQSDTFTPEVVDASGTVLFLGNAITVDWTSQANGTSDGYENAEGGGAYAYSLINAGSTASSATVTEEIGSMGISSPVYQAWWAQAGVNSGAWSGSGNYSTQDSYSQTFTAATHPDFVQMTAYAAPSSNTNDHAKSPAYTFVIGGPTAPAGVSTPYLVTAGQNINLSGLPANSAVWWTYVGWNTRAQRWLDQTTDSTGSLSIPATHPGAIEITADGGTWYVNISQQ